MWTASGPGQLHTKFDLDIRTTTYPVGLSSFKFIFVSLFKLPFYYSAPRAAVQLAVHLTQPDLDPMAHCPFADALLMVQGNYPSNLVPILAQLPVRRGSVPSSLRSFHYSNFQFIIRHQTPVRPIK